MGPRKRMKPPPRLNYSIFRACSPVKSGKLAGLIQAESAREKNIIMKPVKGEG
jgi:hypothetical protein